jgi:predicted small metal-binding protein
MRRVPERRCFMKVVHCPCGVDIQGDSDDELVTSVEAHVRDAHPDMVDQMSREKILEMAHDH